MISVLDKIYERYKDRKRLSKTELTEVLRFILNKARIPIPGDTFNHFVKTGIINELIIELHNSSHETPDNRFAFRDKFTKLLELFPSKRKGQEIKLRIFGNKGQYPLEPVRRGKMRYEVYGSRPNLITINKIESEDQFRNDSWLYWISRVELKFAAAVILSAPYRSFYPYFNPFDTVILNYSDVESVPDNLLFQFMNEWLDIKNSFIEPNGNVSNRDPRPDVSTYSYCPFDPSTSGFNKLFDSISIRNHLLLRSCNYLLKGLMHQGNMLFQEEALLNSFFALEGGLHLLQKKYGDNSSKLNRKLLREVYKSEIKYLPHGEGTFEFIEEGYFTRIALVHPEPDWGAEWNPYVHVGDFREYHGMARLALAWAICEHEIDLGY